VKLAACRVTLQAAKGLSGILLGPKLKLFWLARKLQLVNKLHLM
jgi:hypothetical protein